MFLTLPRRMTGWRGARPPTVIQTPKHFGPPQFEAVGAFVGHRLVDAVEELNVRDGSTRCGAWVLTGSYT